ncbi:hypothetical protein GQ42DRAFT_25007 [Ramicandelaber brevisporus]|nr:hypothetical protein GQ42DRAFT_25007 [Ramicandelaber brevisporus]
MMRMAMMMIWISAIRTAHHLHAVIYESASSCSGRTHTLSPPAGVSKQLAEYRSAPSALCSSFRLNCARVQAQREESARRAVTTSKKNKNKNKSKRKNKTSRRRWRLSLMRLRRRCLPRSSQSLIQGERRSALFASFVCFVCSFRLPPAVAAHIESHIVAHCCIHSQSRTLNRTHALH